MSGDFFLDSPVAPKLDLTGARSQFYRSPRTPSAASSLCRSVTSSAHAGSRKRARYGYSGTDNYNAIGSSDDRIAWGGQSTQFNDPISPAPLVNTDYRLAGGGLGPHKVSFGANTAILEQDDNGEVDYRPSRYSSYPTSPGDGNKRKRERPSSAGDDAKHHAESSTPLSFGWGRAVINLVGGVAGKVWDFCFTGAFRGFYAGGGRGYDVDPPPTNADMTPSLDQSAWEKLHQANGSTAFTFSTPNEPFSSQKKQQTDNDWVLVRNEKTLSTPSPSQIPRRISRRSVATPHSTPQRPGIRPSPKRTSLIPVRPSSSLPQHYQTSQTFTTSSPILDNGLKTPKDSSPLAAEAQRYAAKIRRREKEEDASIRRLNQQLKAMIREGKEALGTKIEIDDTMDMDDF